MLHAAQEEGKSAGFGVVLQFRVVKSAGGTRQRSPQEGIENANEVPEGRHKGLSIHNLGH